MMFYVCVLCYCCCNIVFVIERKCAVLQITAVITFFLLGAWI